MYRIQVQVPRHPSRFKFSDVRLGLRVGLGVGAAFKFNLKLPQY